MLLWRESNVVMEGKQCCYGGKAMLLWKESNVVMVGKQCCYGRKAMLLWWESNVINFKAIYQCNSNIGNVFFLFLPYSKKSRTEGDFQNFRALQIKILKFISSARPRTN